MPLFQQKLFCLVSNLDRLYLQIPVVVFLVWINVLFCSLMVLLLMVLQISLLHVIFLHRPVSWGPPNLVTIFLFVKTWGFPCSRAPGNRRRKEQTGIWAHERRRAYGSGFSRCSHQVHFSNRIDGNKVSLVMDRRLPHPWTEKTATHLSPWECYSSI